MSGWGKADDKTSTGSVALAAPTATFNGATNVAANTITVTAHPFRNGDKVNYVDGGGTQVVGLVDTTDYFITNSTTNTVQLAATEANALHNNPTVITLADGAGASHALTLAFAVGTRGIVTGSGGADFAGAGQETFVGDVIVSGTTSMIVTSINSATEAVVKNLDRGTALTAFSAAAYTLNEKPKSIGADANTSGASVFGVDNTEIASGGDNVASVQVSVGGTNYLEVPAVTFTGGGGSSAAATATVAAGAVSAITVTNVGSSYETVPTVAIAKPKRTIPTSGVTTGTDTIAYTAHGLAVSDQVRYQDGGGTALAGLVDNTVYFVKAVADANSFTLAATDGGAVINLTGTGNNAQFFELEGETLATAVAAKGTGPTGTSAPHSGWVKRTEGTGAQAGRIKYEVLVALSKNGVTGDATDDIEFSD